MNLKWLHLPGIDLFRTPWALVFLALLPVFAWIVSRYGRRATIRYPSIALLRTLVPSPAARWRWIVPACRYVGLAGLVLALARPQKGVEASQVKTEGRDILLVVDTSGSMAAEDFTENGKRQSRLAVVKRVVRDFVAKRHVDRIGLEIFSAEAYTQCPLTLDYDVLLRFLDRVELGMLPDGTAIGMAIASGVNRLRESKAKAKVMVLLTDGQNNAGKITPDTAAGIAKEQGVKIYTIGAGTRGVAPFPTKDAFGRKAYAQMQVDIDDESLTKIAEATGGKYYRATDTASLEKIYDEIDRLEKTELDVTKYYEFRERFPWFVMPGALLLGASLLLSETRFRRIP
ncbi:MAG: VWA domain-containing protein [Planctomycetes bacterium]|nr:VWA domain-containing protein [Planctomycetota bacterium]MBI3848027.1 VWA domain-containing protein [Planctomycetota bacterium]